MDDFDVLLTEAAAVPLDGWDFSWFTGRATEQRPSWGYADRVAARLASASSALDVQTGGGEVYAYAIGKAQANAIGSAQTDAIGSAQAGVTGETQVGAIGENRGGVTGKTRTGKWAATESWQPAVAARTLAPLGGRVVAADGLPFADGAFDLVVSRHPVGTDWRGTARILRPGGIFLSQQIGAGTNRELSEAMLGPLPAPDRRHPEQIAAAARDAGLEVLEVRGERLRLEFFDVGAVAYFLRKVVWTVPGFTIAKFRERLRAVHEEITVEGMFVSHAQRVLIEARAWS
jgi:SAM-dependent methyltransferase